MSRDLDDFMARVIDHDVLWRRMRALAYDDVEPTTFEASALIHLWCGHVRPMNLWFEPGDDLDCLLCGRQTVERVELIETTEYPYPDALREVLHL